MAVTVSVDWDGSSLRIRYAGTFDRREANGSSLAFFDIIAARPEAKRILVDQRDLVGRLSPGELFFLMREMPVIGDPTIRVAVIERNDEREYGLFFENVAANSRQGVRVFFSEDEAVRWLSHG